MRPGEVDLPASGIEIMRKEGFLAWPTKQDDVIKTYFTKPLS